VGVVDRAEVLADLASEGDALDRVVGDLEDTGWLAPTHASPWTVAAQIAHLAWTDEVALRAVTDPDGFSALVAEARGPLERMVDEAATGGGAADPEHLLARWRRSRGDLASALTEVADGVRIPWFGPPMSPTSLATARLMETWAHGLDVTDALGLPPTVSPRLRHVCHLGVRTRDFAFATRGLPAPAEPFRVELVAPDGSVWAWGPEDAGQRVTGPALDFCLRVTRRRHRDDLDLRAEGPDADRWLDLAQAFAGPPGEDRPPGAVGAPP
jgi:uncharacterized protein (TIGR03084 family)